MNNTNRLVATFATLTLMLSCLTSCSSDDDNSSLAPVTIDQGTPPNIPTPEEENPEDPTVGPNNEEPVIETPIAPEETNSTLQCDSGSTPLITEQNGLIIVEAEAANVDSTGWSFKNDISGASGDGFLVWDGADSFGNPGNGLLTYNIEVSTPGTYRFIWRSRITIGTSGTEHNDSWLRFPDADDFFGQKNLNELVFPRGSGKTPEPNGAGSNGWLKTYMNVAGAWTWAAFTSDNDAHSIFVTFNEARTYTMEISGRSNGHAIDKFTLFIETDGTNDDLPSSEISCQ